MVKTNIRYVLSIIVLLTMMLSACSFRENVTDEDHIDSEESNYYEAFADFLENDQLYENIPAGTYNNSETELVFSLENIDEDNIPELIVGWTKTLNDSSDICVLKYHDGIVSKIGPIGYYNVIEFIPQENKILINNTSQGICSYVLFEIDKDGSQKTLCESYLKADDASDLTDFQDKYYVLGNEVNKEEFDQYLIDTAEQSQMIGWSGESNKYNLNILNEESIENLRCGQIETGEMESYYQSTSDYYSNDIVTKCLASIEGEYEYTDINGTVGSISISPSDYGVYNIDDYYSNQAGYRFSANSYLVDMVDKEKIYFKYPDKTVYKDDELYYEYSYYVIEKSANGITVSYSPESYEKVSFLYEAVSSGY